MSAPNATKKSEQVAPILGIKGYDKNLVCHPDGGRRQQYEIGQTYKHKGRVKACKSGFHAVTGHPLAVFGFYPPARSRYTVVELSGETDSDEIKTAAKILKVGKEVGLGDLAAEAVKWVSDRAKWTEGPTAHGSNEAAQASGTRGAAQASGYQGAAQASGYQGAAQASGDQGAAQASGDQGAAQASGYQGAAQASGTRGAAQASGYQGAAQASGKFSAAMAVGFEGQVKGVDGSALFLVERANKLGDPEHGKIIAVWAGIVGQDGIKPNVFYTLRSGQPVEVA